MCCIWASGHLADCPIVWEDIFPILVQEVYLLCWVDVYVYIRHTKMNNNKKNEYNYMYYI